MAGITYKIKADGSGYTKTLKSMRNDTQKFGADVKAQMAGIGGALKVALAYVGISGLRSISQEFVNMSRQAKTLGMNAVEFQKLSKVALQFGIDSETLGDAIKDLNVKITDGALGAKSYAEAFELVGLNMEDVKKMTPTEQFYAFSDAIKAAGGNLSRFELDEVNDAMFRMGQMMSLGSEEIIKMADGYDVLTQAQLDNLESAEKSIQNLTDKFKIMVGEVMSKYAQMAKELSGIFDRLDKRAGGSKNPLPQDMSKDYDFEFGKGYTLKETPKKNEGGDIGEGIIDPKEFVEAQKKDAAMRKLSLKEEAKQLEEQEKRKQALMSDEEKLLDIQKKRIAAEKELGELGERLHSAGNASAEDAFKLAEATTRWEKLQTEEQQKQLDIQQKKQAITDKLNQQEKRGKEQLAFTSAAIEAEKRGREEIGMTDEQILKRRKKELAQMQKDLTTGIFGGAEDVADAELAISKKKTEIKQLDLDIKASKKREDEELAAFFRDVEILDGKADPQTSIISSSLASIGGGGGTASFGNDPMLSESKKQSNLLEQLVSLQGGTIEGGGNLVVPEL